MSGPPPADPWAEHGEHGKRAAVAEAEEGGEGEEGEEGEEGAEEEGPLGELHELAVNLLYVLIALHLMGVVFETRRSGPQIARSMLPGGKRG